MGVIKAPCSTFSSISHHGDGDDGFRRHGGGGADFHLHDGRAHANDHDACHQTCAHYHAPVHYRVAA